MRGGERVLALICEQFPQAGLYTLLQKPNAVDDVIAKQVKGTSWLQQFPGISRYYRYMLPLFPAAVRSLKSPDADLVISTSHCVAKGIPIREGTKHLCYCFTPMRYAWVFYEEYFGRNPIKKQLMKTLLTQLREWDKRTSESVTRFVAISKHIQERIKRYYGRESDVVYPPVDVQRLNGNGLPPENFDLVVSALVPYKRIELAVEAYNRLGFPLKIVGTGTEFHTLKKNAGKNIEFLGWQHDDEIKKLYQQCRCLIFPGEEDFGIVPVEVQACGRPVVAYAKGGALETVINGKTGVFFQEQSVDALLYAIEECRSVAWNPTIIRQNAERFSQDHFLRGLHGSIQACLSE